MWWLLKDNQAPKKSSDHSTCLPSGEAPMKWMKVDLNDSSVGALPNAANLSQQRKHAKKIAPIREVQKPDKRSLRLPLENLKISGKSKDLTGQKAAGQNSNVEEKFPVPSSWRGPMTPNSNLLHEKKFSVTTIKLPRKEVEYDLEPSLSEKLRILKEQENYTPSKPRYAVPESLEHKKDGRKVSEAERKLCNWISLEIKPLIGRLEGSIRSASSIGKKLNSKSKQLNLWHEEFSHSTGRAARSILLHDVISGSQNKIIENAAKKKVTASEKEVCKPICHLLRVSLPHEVRASPRISPEDQVKDIEKGGHGSTRDKLADYNMLVESLRRQRDARMDKEAARMLLCKGIIHDNAQEFAKAVESYKEYLILCIKNGDKEGEAIAYNFIACSLQEEQDLKLADTQEISSSAAIQYEKAEEYHKLHTEVANNDGKFVAYTNLGLLYANMGRWTDAAVSHQMALKFATLTERPDRQGVAVGNLGFMLFRQKEWVTAKACMVKYLQICNALKDIQGQGRAHYILGSIASYRKRYDEAIIAFEASLKAARLMKDVKLETLSKIMLGVAQGDNLLEKQELLV
ncbi:hypothetical protein KP509_23G007300 [Ceratopteris richardii]|uniref:Tetratricopeptide repeat protein 29 n=1 Tax=Ceratopteris richardii TaxID=49495 RepID=A0A8T2RYR8_CERRI|nr:hypothetical protein KP509_23G007300 [Ceratopteris richardii]